MRGAHKVIIERMEKKIKSKTMSKSFPEQMEDSGKIFERYIHTYTYYNKSAEHHS